MRETVKILGVEIDNITLEEAGKITKDLIEKLDQFDLLSSRNHVNVSVINHEKGITPEFMTFILSMWHLRMCTYIQ